VVTVFVVTVAVDKAVLNELVVVVVTVSAVVNDVFAAETDVEVVVFDVVAVVGVTAVVVVDVNDAAVLMDVRLFIVNIRWHLPVVEVAVHIAEAGTSPQLQVP